MSGKREDYISWDEYFMGVAQLSGMRSKDPGTQVGSCIVSKENKILSMGYNGFPNGCDDEAFPWAREGGGAGHQISLCDPQRTECDPELSGRFSGGTKLYVSLFPCNECAKAIIQAGIRTVVYASDKYKGTPSNVASKRMFDAAGVEYVAYHKTGRKVELEL